MTEDELKRCPFCGGEAYIPACETYGTPFGWIQCVECEADGPPHTDNIEKAIEAWNTRKGGSC